MPGTGGTVAVSPDDDEEDELVEPVEVPEGVDPVGEALDAAPAVAPVDVPPEVPLLDVELPLVPLLDVELPVLD